MQLSSYNPHNRYRERAQARLTNAISMVLVIALSACVGFWMGKQYGVEQNISLEDQVESLTKERRPDLWRAFGETHLDPTKDRQLSGASDQSRAYREKTED